MRFRARTLGTWALAILAVTACGGAATPRAAAPSPHPPLAQLPPGWVQPSPDHRPDPPIWPPPAPWTVAPSLAEPPDPGALSYPIPSPQGPPSAGHHPAASPFRSLSHGYDQSFPQCTAGRAPSAAAFSVIGVNGGKAFTLNRCFLWQWVGTSLPLSMYLNSGYNPLNSHRAVAECVKRAAAVGPDAVHSNAYAVGCSTAADSLAALDAVGFPTPTTWWVDVENGNSWDETDLSLNRLSIQGEIDMLATRGRPVGVYSTFPDWQVITGGWSYPGIAGDWVAGKTPAEACAKPGFSGAPVWLAQELATWPDPSGWDSDYAC